jgi:L-asparagine oxygenase
MVFLSIVNAQIMKSSISQQLDYCGYAHLERFQPERPTLKLARDFGKILKIPGVPVVQRIVPRQQADAPTNLYSGNYGLQEFPLHTDLAHWYIPPRYLFLRCMIAAPHVLTTLVDFSAALAGIPETTIIRAQVLPRRKVDGKRHLLRILQEMEGKRLFRWDSLFIIPANHEAEEINDHITNLQVKLMTKKICFTYPGDMLIVDNWRMLHGRSSVPNSSVDRVVERVYLGDIKS